MLQLSNLHVYHGPVEAVRGISLEVPMAKCTALLGPNGAGKTSTISAITGIAQCRGQITLDGNDITSRSVEQRVHAGISVSPEGRRIFASLTVRENLRLGGATQSDKSLLQQDIEKWLDTFPILGERQQQQAGTLSGGEQQMLAIARALMVRPKILLLDEPSLGLAPKIVGQIFRMIEALVDSGITVLLVEQNATQALRLADYAYLMSNGVIVNEGTAESLGENADLMASLTGIA